MVSLGRWPFVGERFPTDSGLPWNLVVEGRVTQSVGFSMEEIVALPQTEIVTDIHCVTRWSKLDTRFSGVLLETLLENCQISSDAIYVSFVARSDRRHSSSLLLEEAIQLGTLLATHYEGKPLSADHGGPLRGVVPGKYFYKSVKWVERIILLVNDSRGYWEAETGYHNNADPWLEQRYIASSVSKREASALIARKDFSNLNLLSIDVASLDLTGLVADSATLRNSNFDGCILTGANFRNANLSNANFRNADLRGADFGNADLEGADFAAADLRGSNLTGCSLFGTTFCDASTGSVHLAALMDCHTKIDRHFLDELTKPQREFIERFLD